jgi:hypothetical protein
MSVILAPALRLVLICVGYASRNNAKEIENRKVGEDNDGRYDE